MPRFGWGRLGGCGLPRRFRIRAWRGPLARAGDDRPVPGTTKSDVGGRTARRRATSSKRRGNSYRLERFVDDEGDRGEQRPSRTMRGSPTPLGRPRWRGCARRRARGRIHRVPGVAGSLHLRRWNVTVPGARTRASAWALAAGEGLVLVKDQKWSGRESNPPLDVSETPCETLGGRVTARLQRSPGHGGPVPAHAERNLRGG
jgi:hypothetical protein